MVVIVIVTQDGHVVLYQQGVVQVVLVIVIVSYPRRTRCTLSAGCNTSYGTSSTSYGTSSTCYDTSIII